MSDDQKRRANLRHNMYNSVINLEGTDKTKAYVLLGSMEAIFSEIGRQTDELAKIYLGLGKLTYELNKISMALEKQNKQK